MRIQEIIAEFVVVVLVILAAPHVAKYIVLLSLDGDKSQQEMYTREEQTETEILASTIRDVNSSTYTDNAEFESKLAAYQQVNSDVIAYMVCEDLGIEEPIVYSETDNSIYLRKNVYGQDDVNGTLYLDYRCAPLKASIYLVHGHNMKSGEQFASLPTLLNRDTLDGLSTVKFYDADGYREYRIVSVISVNSNEATIDLEPFASVQELQALKYNMLQKSATPVSEVPDGVDLLLLNTCYYGDSGNEHNLHCIVMCVRETVAA